MKTNCDKIKNIIITILGILFACWLLFHSCGHSKPEQYVRSTKIQSGLKKERSLKDSVRIKDSIRIHWVDKYRKDKSVLKGFPCDSVLPIIIADCDTVIIKDSTELVAMRKLRTQDSLLIVDYQIQGNLDSVTIGKLERKVHRNRTLAKLAFVTWIGLGGFVGVKLH